MSHFGVPLWTRCGPRLQCLYLLEDKVDFSLCCLIIVVATADTHTHTKLVFFYNTLWLFKGKKNTTFLSV